MRVLVADDDDDMRALVAAVLATAGHTVTEAADGAGAWTICERDAPEFVVLDWQMPGLSGIEVCERLRARAAPAGTEADPPYVLIVTARGATDDLQRVLDAGADDYLSKPLTAEALATRVIIGERRMAADRARRSAEDALRRAQWVAGIAETAIAVQHEINNPLTALLGNVALLESGVRASPAEERESMRIIADQATRIAAVVRRLATLRDPRSVEYLRGTRMLDLSSEHE
ncbi:MAG TPA: response regulator [Gemmatimonadaceae bacterium]|jgi:DNA-binding response OmpR family regulator|nr:response regulator [Gemmatimonadaceae bacterium]